MTGLSTHMALVAQLFPGEEAAVKTLAMRCERFRSLCEDYGLAMETLALMETGNLPHDAESIAEYRRLTSELQAELSQAFREESQ